MRTCLIFVLTAALGSTAVAAGNGYRFHLSFTDAATALRAGSPALFAKYSEEQLSRMAKKNVFLFANASGAHWTWLSLGCPPSKPACEFSINSRGSCDPKSPGCDIGFSNNGDGTIRARCYRESCTLRVTPRGGSQIEKHLAAREADNFPLDSDFDLTFEGASVTPEPQK